MSMWPDHSVLNALSAWLVTYWLHAGVLHLGALGLARWVPMPLRSRDRLWRVALLFPIATASAAQVVPDWPFTGLMQRADIVSAQPERFRITVHSRVTDGGAIANDVAVRQPGARLSGLVLVCFLAAALPGVGLHVGRLRRRARLRELSRDAEGHTAHHRLDIDSRRCARVRIADLPPELGVAFAAGARDIVLSSDAAALSSEHWHAVLSHELAHLRRRDPLWLGAAAWLSALFAFQPSHRLIAARMRRDAEFACDRIALERVSSLELYLDCLVTLATRFDPCESPAFASSLVVQRAEHLVRGGEEEQRVPVWAFITIVGVGVLLAWTAHPGSRSARLTVSAVADTTFAHEVRAATARRLRATTVVVRAHVSTSPDVASSKPGQ